MSVLHPLTGRMDTGPSSICLPRQVVVSTATWRDQCRVAAAPLCAREASSVCQINVVQAAGNDKQAHPPRLPAPASLLPPTCQPLSMGLLPSSSSSSSSLNLSCDPSITPHPSQVCASFAPHRFSLLLLHLLRLVHPACHHSILLLPLSSPPPHLHLHLVLSFQPWCCAVSQCSAKLAGSFIIRRTSLLSVLSLRPTRCVFHLAYTKQLSAFHQRLPLSLAFFSLFTCLETRSVFARCDMTTWGTLLNALFFPT